MTNQRPQSKVAWELQISLVSGPWIILLGSWIKQSQKTKGSSFTLAIKLHKRFGPIIPYAYLQNREHSELLACSWYCRQGNDLETVPTEALSTLSALRRLNLRHTALNHVESFAFRGLRRLEYLDLGDNRLPLVVHDDAFCGVALDLDLHALVAAPPNYDDDDDVISVERGTPILVVTTSGESAIDYDERRQYVDEPNAGRLSALMGGAFTL